MELSTTEKGKRNIIHEGYMYVFQRSLANDATSCECEKGSKREYKAKKKLMITQMHHLKQSVK